MYTDLQDALCELFNGRKIRRDDWRKEVYVKLNEDGRIVDNNDLRCELSLFDRDSLKNMVCGNWEILPTVEELLITKGKTYDIGTFCNNFNKVCEDCPVYAECNAVKGSEYFVDMLTSEDFKDDEWFSRNMLTINEMWDKLNKED